MGAGESRPTSQLDTAALLKAATTAGYEVSERLLESLRAQGLVPRPTRAGNRGRFPVWVYPDHSDQQLVALLTWRQRTTNSNVLRVLLWLDGYPVPLTAVRAALVDHLCATVVTLDRELAVIAERHGLDLEADDQRDQVLHVVAGTIAGKRGRKSLPRRSRTSSAQRTRAVELLLRTFALGEQIEVAPTDAEAVERVLGLAPNGRRHRVDDVGPWLSGPAEELFNGADLVAFPRLLDAVNNATDGDLDAARLLVVVLWRCLPLAARLLAALFDDDNYTGMAVIANLDESPDMVMMLVPAVVGMLKAGWREHLDTIADALVGVADTAVQAQQLPDLPAKTVEANLTKLPVDQQQRVHRIIEATIDGRLDPPRLPTTLGG